MTKRETQSPHDLDTASGQPRDHAGDSRLRSRLEVAARSHDTERAR